MNNYNICVSEEEFKNAICNHYHGDYGMCYSTFADNERNIWQCSCGYRAVTNKIFNIVVSDLIKERYNS